MEQDPTRNSTNDEAKHNSSPETLKEVAVRTERLTDYDAIHEVELLAFAPDTRQAELVRAIRESPGYIPELSLVAESDNEVIAHIMLSKAELDENGKRTVVLYLSPLAVRPDKQHQGVGPSLIQAALAVAGQREEPLVILEGNPSFYSKVGFKTAKRLGVTMHLPKWASIAAGQAYTLPNYSETVRGHLILPPTFDIVHED